jgi:hypothetical protein
MAYVRTEGRKEGEKQVRSMERLESLTASFKIRRPRPRASKGHCSRRICYINFNENGRGDYVIQNANFRTIHFLLFTVYPAWLTSPALSSISYSTDSDSGEAFTAVRAYSLYTYE